MSVRPSVCLSVTGRCCVKTAVQNTDLGILAWSLNSFDICPYVKEIWVFSEIRILSSGTVSKLWTSSRHVDRFNVLSTLPDKDRRLAR